MTNGRLTFAYTGKIVVFFVSIGLPVQIVGGHLHTYYSYHQQCNTYQFFHIYLKMTILFHIVNSLSLLLSNYSPNKARNLLMLQIYKKIYYFSYFVIFFIFPKKIYTFAN